MTLIPTILIPTEGEEHSAGNLLFAGFERLHYPVELIDYDEFYRSYKNNVSQFYLCVEDGRGERTVPNLHRLNLYGSKSNLAVWVTNRNALLKDRLDLWRQMRPCRIFFSDYDDFFALMNRVICSWLPPAADSDLCVRRNVLKDVDVVAMDLTAEHNSDLEKALGANQKLIKARPRNYFGRSWYGHMIGDFDRGRIGIVDRMSMTVFEMLACGLPILVDATVNHGRIFGSVPFIVEYTGKNFAEVIRSSLADGKFLSSGNAAREWILQFATYEVRAEMIIDMLVSSGRLPAKARDFIRGEGVRK